MDAVVAENGAVVEFPDSGYVTVSGQPPAALLVEALEPEHIPVAVGRVVVEADAAHAERNSVRQLETDYRSGRLRDLPAVLTRAVRSRYEFLEPFQSMSR